jgi:hypothetical protein
MTLPDERTQAVLYARELLSDLLDPKKTPRVPRVVRRRALSVLRHFPHATDMRRPAEAFAKLPPAISDLTKHLARRCGCGHTLSMHQDWGVRLDKNWAHEALECRSRGCRCLAFESAQ